LISIFIIMNLQENIQRIKQMMGLLTEQEQEKEIVLIDGTSSAGKSKTAEILKAVPFYKSDDPNRWVQIDSDMFGGIGGQERRFKWDPPSIQGWAKDFEYGINSGLYRKDGKDVPENPVEDEYIEGTDPRNWYMAQEYKYGGWKKIIFDDIDDGILKYVPNVKHVLLHAPIPILLSNIKAREEEDPRDIDEVLNQYLEKYEATTSKPSKNIGDPDTVLTKSGLEELLSQYTTDQKYIDDFIKKLGITGNGNYYIKARNIDPNKTVLVNVDQKSRDAKVAPAKLQQMFNKIK